MNRFSRYLAVAFILLTMSSWPGIARAVSYSSVVERHEEKIAKGIRERGETVCLFQSGTADVRKEIQIDDVLVVYRETTPKNLSKRGKIKVLSFVGEDYLKGVVVEGEVQTGDIAKKGDAASMVISSEDKRN